VGQDCDKWLNKVAAGLPVGFTQKPGGNQKILLQDYREWIISSKFKKI
jgi:hypothetical protein